LCFAGATDERDDVLGSLLLELASMWLFGVRWKLVHERECKQWDRGDKTISTVSKQFFSSHTRGPPSCSPNEASYIVGTGSCAGFRKRGFQYADLLNPKAEKGVESQPLLL